MSKKQFVPRNMRKYTGKHLPIARSTWEEKFMHWLDANPSVKKWCSECVVINYIDPTKLDKNGRVGRKRRYYPDFYFETEKNSKIQAFLVEIKPYKEVIQPKKSGRKSRKTMIYESNTYKVNVAKWKAAQYWCDKMGVIWKIITEKELFNNQ